MLIAAIVLAGVAAVGGWKAVKAVFQLAFGLLFLAAGFMIF